MKQETIHKAKVVPNIKSSKPSERMAAVRISKAKGTKHHKTKVLEKVGISKWEEFGQWLTTKGVDDYREAMQELSPRDKIVAFNAIIEYYKPKLTRSQVDVNANVVIENISFE
jgi:hypothetical protein